MTGLEISKTIQPCYNLRDAISKWKHETRLSKLPIPKQKVVLAEELECQVKDTTNHSSYSVWITRETACETVKWRIWASKLKNCLPWEPIIEPCEMEIWIGLKEVGDNHYEGVHWHTATRWLSVEWQTTNRELKVYKKKTQT